MKMRKNVSVRGTLVSLKLGKSKRISPDKIKYTSLTVMLSKMKRDRVGEYSVKTLANDMYEVTRTK